MGRLFIIDSSKIGIKRILVSSQGRQIYNPSLQRRNKRRFVMEFGQKLYDLVDGNMDERFEATLQLLYGQTNEVWGAYMPLSSFLLSEEHVENTLFELAHKYWHYIHKQYIFTFRAADVDWQFVNERLDFFFNTKENKAKLFHYVGVHQQLTFESLFYFIFERKATFPQAVSDLLTIHLYKVGELYYLQPIFSRQERYWQQLFSKKIYSIFMQAELEQIQESSKLMQELQKALLINYTKKQTAKTIHKLVTYLTAQNEKSFTLKHLELFNVLSHFTGGRRHKQKLQKLTLQLYERWREGEWRLSEKEQALTTYLLMCAAYEKRDYKMTRECGYYLLQNNRIYNHAVEILIEYEHFLNSFNPQTSSLIKNYKANYLEYAFYMLIHACTQLKQFKEVHTLLRDYESSCCTALYSYFNDEERGMDYTIVFEEMMRADIAGIVGKPSEEKSVAHWQANYLGDYKNVVKTTSKILCNILKMAHVLGDQQLFWILYPLYEKYVYVPAHAGELKRFMR